MSAASHDFTTAAPDFAGSVFTTQDLIEARGVFRLAMERYSAGWETAPIGVMAQLWNQDARPAVERLIDIARVLFDFSRGITLESAPAFEHKVRQLLSCKDEAQFDELLAELRVGALLAVRAGPVACEPLARPLDYRSSAQPRSPDFAIRLPESDILIEVTTLRIGALDYWERALAIIRERIRDAVVAAGMAKEVEIHAPLRVRADALTRRVIDRLLTEMKRARDGALDVELGPVSIRVMWREMTFLQLPLGASDLDAMPKDPFSSKEHFSAVIGSAANISSASASKIVPILGPNVEELFLKSIRNTVEGKRPQFMIQAPSLLVLQPGAWRLPPDYVHHLIDKRLWPNPQYRWLTGIGILQPRRTFGATEPTTKLTVSWNPSPSEARTTALNDLFEANAWFSNGLRIEAPQ
jgi:hypothetical protein